MSVKRGEIYVVSLIEKDSRGQEIGKKRPAIIVQADLWNKYLPSTIILPLTSQEPVYLGTANVLLEKGGSGLEVDSFVLFPQLRSVDKSRLEKKIGELSNTKMQAVDKALSLTLGLTPLDS